MTRQKLAVILCLQLVKEFFENCLNLFQQKKEKDKSYFPSLVKKTVRNASSFLSLLLNLDSSLVIKTVCRIDKSKADFFRLLFFLKNKCMKNCKNYVGIDVSKLSFDVAIPNAESGYKHHKLSNNEKGFAVLLNLLVKEENVWVVMEASGPYYLKLATFLSEKMIGVCVINPLVIRRFCQMRMSRTKTDKKDAMMIAEYGKAEEPACWIADADYVLALKQMQAYLDQLNKNRTALIRQREAFSQNTHPSLAVHQSLSSMLATLEKEIKGIENAMELIIKKHHQEMFNQLQSIPGLGKKTTLVLIVISGGFTKFENHKQLASYVGISPRIFESGTSVKGRSRICKMGMSRIRAMLYLCAWSAKRYNKACKDLYDRLVEKGKSKKLALIAVVNKLLKQAFAIATKKEFYLAK